MHAVEEAFEVQVHHPAGPGRDVRAGTADRAVRAASRAEAEAAVRKRGVDEGRQDLEEGLLNESVEGGGNPQRPHALPARLRNSYAPDRLRLIATAEEFLPDTRPVLTTKRHQVVDGHPVDAGCACVLHHARIRGEHVLPPQRLLEEP
jgi:hypothetical protein